METLLEPMSAKQDKGLDSSRPTIVISVTTGAAGLPLLQLAPINQWKEELSIEDGCIVIGGAELLFYLDKQLCYKSYIKVAQECAG